ncbi:Rv1355c family protein [Nocardia sp. NPDC127526]|uniref:Rv1355c family protein n=1 Tax=Nocardia sp. NPDC127526 TaxID=3345393 RepID=UPI0036383F9B
MTLDHLAANDYRPQLLDASDAGDARTLAGLRSDGRIEFTDLRSSLRAEFAALVAHPELDEGPDADRWAFYPWRRAVVGIPGPRLLRAVRLDRNRNKITRLEQDELAKQTVGVIGQSVGHAVAHTLAMEGSCGRIRLADFDAIELTNLNRVPGTLFDVGVNKAVVTARRIAELDPYLPVEVFADGITDANMDTFLDGLSLVVEVCDSLDIKLSIREAARRHRLPLLMETSDRGLLDVERFDLEPDRPPFHGLMGDITAADLRGLSTREKTPFALRIVDGSNVSDRLAASLVEIGQSLNGWPQLGGDVQLGGASAAAAVRRIGLGLKLPSGRTRIDLDSGLDSLAEPAPVAELAWPEESIATQIPQAGVSAVLASAQQAPSGGNTQPWALHADTDKITISLAPERSSLMDIGYRASALAVGAALYNARATAAALGLLGGDELSTGGVVPLTATLRLSDGSDPALARDYPALLDRHTNRNFGSGEPLAPSVLEALAEVAIAAGGNVRAVIDRPGIESAAAILAASDRTRYLTPRMHAEMFSELRLPGEDSRTGLDLRTLELAPDELAKLDIIRRAEVLAQVRAVGGGAALGEGTRVRTASGSAVAVVTFPAPALDTSDLADYARAGEVLQRVWIEAQRQGLAVHPTSPIFLFARRPEELGAVSPEFADTLTSLQGRFLDLLGVPDTEVAALVLRLSYAPAATLRSRRLPVPEPAPRS